MDNGWQTDLNMSTGLVEVTYLLFMDTPEDFANTHPSFADTLAGKDRARTFRFTA